MENNCSKGSLGFTLVELLVVISIVSLLAGVSLMIINPPVLQRKAKEASLKSSVVKVCSALFSCASVKSSSYDCDDYTKVGIKTPTEPLNAEFVFVPPNLENEDKDDDGLVTFSGSYTTGPDKCTYSCSFNFLNGEATNLTKSGSCL